MEVLQGRTPFLLSNSVLSSLRAVVDIESKRMWSKGSRSSIPLKTNRKNLMRVDLAKLLSMDMGDTENSSQDIHVTTSHEGIQGESCSSGKEGSPKEKGMGELILGIAVGSKSDDNYP